MSPEDHLGELIDGYRNTALLYVAAKLGVADLLSPKSATAREMEQRLCLKENSLGRVLRALAVLGIVREDSEEKFSLTRLGSGLCAGAPGCAQARAILAGEEFLPTWGALLAAVQTGEPQFQRLFGMSAWEHRKRNPELSAAFNSWLREQTAQIGDSILRAYDFAWAREVADVGGGYGGLLSAILLARPHLRGVLIDLPNVVTEAQSTLAAAGLIDRCQIQGADFFIAVPPGSDVYLLKSVLHDWDDAHGKKILSNCRQAMSSTSRLLIVERIMHNHGETDSATAMLDVHMWVMFDGRERSIGDYSKLVTAADLRVTRVFSTDAGFQLIEASVRDAGR